MPWNGSAGRRRFERADDLRGREQHVIGRAQPRQDHREGFVTGAKHERVGPRCAYHRLRLFDSLLGALDTETKSELAKTSHAHAQYGESVGATFDETPRGAKNA